MFVSRSSLIEPEILNCLDAIIDIKVGAWHEIE